LVAAAEAGWVTVIPMGLFLVEMLAPLEVQEVEVRLVATIHLRQGELRLLVKDMREGRELLLPM
jgi:hypothetical protein